MITIFISRLHTYTINAFLKNWPNQVASSIRLIPYQSLHRIRCIQPGLFVFSDIERLTTIQHRTAEHLCQQISENFGEIPILNHPTRVLSRYHLLSLLWKQGINRFRVFSWADREEPMRYPVFIRRANDHEGPLTDLIMSKESFNDQWRSLQASGEDPGELIAVEFCDTCGEDQLYRKYSAFRIGDCIIPGHIIFSKNWVAKDRPPEPLRNEEKAYLENNPHQGELIRIFRLANIEYGRIDYGLLDGKIQVWEINTNPVLIQRPKKYSMFKLPIKQKLVDELAEAFLSQDAHADDLRAKSKTVMVNLAPSGPIKFLRQIERFFHPIRL